MTFKSRDIGSPRPESANCFLQKDFLVNLNIPFLSANSSLLPQIKLEQMSRSIVQIVGIVNLFGKENLLFETPVVPKHVRSDKTSSIFVIFSVLTLAQHCYGYIDMSTGSYFLQIVLALIFGVIFSLRASINKLQRFLFSIIRRKTTKRPR